MSAGHGPTILFWAYDADEPSFRHRVAIIAAEMRRRGWQCETEILPRGRYVRRVLERRAQLASADVLFLHRIKVSPFELGPLRRFARAIVYDFDDAIYFRRPRRLGEEPDRSWWRRYKFERTCARADLVLAGNETLASAARRSAARVETVPTSVDLASYEGAVGAREPKVIVWIGRPENVVYLELIRPVLARLRNEYSDLRLRVVSSAFPDWSDVPVERVPWSEKVEVPSLMSAGIGVMPLTDDDWTRGKCAFKLLQYMAAGLPAVGSDVGANRDVVVHGESGLLAASERDWETALRTLLGDDAAARRMGAAGRARVGALYDQRVVAARVADLLCELSARSVGTTRCAEASDPARESTTTARG